MEAELIITSSKSGKTGTCNREERCDLCGSGCFDFKVSKTLKRSHLSSPLASDQAPNLSDAPNNSSLCLRHGFQDSDQFLVAHFLFAGLAWLESILCGHCLSV